MIEFWVAAVWMLLIGYVFFLPVLLGKTKAGRPSRARLNLLLHRQRQQELALEGASPEDLAKLAAESERNLLNDLEAAQDPAARPATAGRTAVIVALVLLPLAGLTAYLGLGRPDLLGEPAAREAAQKAQVEDSIRELADRLKENPNDLQGWMLLGRSLQATGQPGQAVTAYEFALRLAPEDLDLKALYVQALAEASQGRLGGRPTELIAEILAKNPDHPNALWLAGLAAVERKEADQALAYWEKLQRQFVPDSEEARQLGRYIAEVRGLPAPADPAPESAPAARPGLKVKVQVTLSDALKARAASDDALFIFARAAEGPPMPLAVVRKQVKDLPVEVTLDDSMAMMPGLSLSSFDRIVFGARVSKTGQPTPSPGDLQGIGAPVTPENEGRYPVVVDRVVGEPGG
jgi:cytochrome c-type biogenesis protein CcmH